MVERSNCKGHGPNLPCIMPMAPNLTTFKSTTLIVGSCGLLGKCFTIRNLIGSNGHQVVAVKVSSDQMTLTAAHQQQNRDMQHASNLREVCDQSSAPSNAFRSIIPLVQSLFVANSLILSSAPSRKNPSYPHYTHSINQLAPLHLVFLGQQPILCHLPNHPLTSVKLQGDALMHRLLFTCISFQGSIGSTWLNL